MHSIIITIITFFLALSASASPYLPQTTSTPRRSLSCAQVATFNHRLDNILHTRLPAALPNPTVAGVHDELIALQTFLEAYHGLVKSQYSSCSGRRDVANKEHNLAARQAGNASFICQFLEAIFGDPEDGSSSKGVIAARTAAPVPNAPAATATAVGMHMNMLSARQDIGGFIDIIREVLYGFYGCGADEGGGGGGGGGGGRQ
ncbi:hypothetical protein BJX68DRAFT_181988 [Aspergillus pseudodeflectus]|uniref:Uncharacterized protein n=1 Tax=Aspergillus pseudodeflectus TaxID=176178 RepID=A0ABR4JLL3_9EURO